MFGWSGCYVGKVQRVKSGYWYCSKKTADLAYSIFSLSRHCSLLDYSTHKIQTNSFYDLYLYTEANQIKSTVIRIILTLLYIDIFVSYY